jgi:DNA-binding NarL/FixJ family response regulator
MKPTEETSSPIRLLIIEDQGMVRAFFERLLEERSAFEISGSARSGEQALSLLESLKPDVALVDLQLPGMDGLEFVRLARQVRPQLRALIVSSRMDPLTLTRVRESGVEGYLEKDGSPEELILALETVARGGQYHSEKFRETLAREGAKAQSVGKILSKREQQVLGLVLESKSNRDIAEAMRLSVRTVEFHRLNLMTKLEATNLSELIASVRLRGWVIPTQET